jgi:hypothetical protein
MNYVIVELLKLRLRTGRGGLVKKKKRSTIEPRDEGHNTLMFFNHLFTVAGFKYLNVSIFGTGTFQSGKMTVRACWA